MPKLTPKKRKRLAKSSFAVPSKRAYPINDLPHARNALARVAQHGSASQKASVRRKVYAKYPSLRKRKKKR
jgi:hypothetical protein